MSARRVDLLLKIKARLEAFYQTFSPIAWLTDIFQAEQLRWFLFAPVLFGVGIGFYFSLDHEPSLLSVSLMVLVPLAILSATGFGLGFKHLMMPVLVGLLMFGLGFARAYEHAHSIAAPILSKQQEAVLEGRIVKIDATRPQKSQRWIIQVLSIEGLAPDQTPYFVRLKVKPFKGRGLFKTGDHIHIKAILFPPPKAALPGGYDFARRLWFEQIGAIGVSQSLPVLQSRPQTQSFSSWLDNFRNAIALHIDKSLSSKSAGGIAAALIVGKRGFIPEATNVKLRDTGLAHILAISGLHMALFAGTVYFLFRLVFALSPFLVLRMPIKKWAMIPALLASLIYLLLAGGSVATQRAFIMFVVAGFAVLNGAQVITMRNVAIAAIAILVLYPESLLQAGFQLSFAATIAIVAIYEQVSLQRFRAAAMDGSLTKLRHRTELAILTLALTSLAAWAATAPLSQFHFNRLVFLPALLANLAVLPLFTLWIMPTIVIVLPLILLGGEKLVLIFLSLGIETILAIIGWIVEHIGAAWLVPAPPFYLLLAYVLGGLWFCLWQGRWRWLGAAVLVAVLAQALLIEPLRYDVLIAREGNMMAVRAEDGLLYPSSRANGFMMRQWLRADGDTRSPWSAYDKEQFRCTSSACVRIIGDKKIILLRRPDKDLCVDADIVIGASMDGCVGQLYTISRKDLAHKGVHAILFKGRFSKEERLIFNPVEKRLWSNIPETGR